MLSSQLLLLCTSHLVKGIRLRKLFFLLFDLLQDLQSNKSPRVVVHISDGKANSSGSRRRVVGIGS